MREYKFKNCMVYVRGDISKERLEKATLNFMKKVQKYKVETRKVEV